MFKELIRTMGFLYSYASRGRGKLNQAQLRSLSDTGAVLVGNAEAVLGDEKDGLTQDEKTDLEQAVMMEQHIDEMVTWLIGLEIV